MHKGHGLDKGIASGLYPDIYEKESSKGNICDTAVSGLVESCWLTSVKCHLHIKVTYTIFILKLYLNIYTLILIWALIGDASDSRHSIPISSEKG